MLGRTWVFALAQAGDMEESVAAFQKAVSLDGKEP